jgi:hypothetical protein
MVRLDSPGGHTLAQRSILATAILLVALVQPAVGQEPAIQADSAPVLIRAVLRAYYLNLANQNWDALSSYVLSPKLLERRGAPRDAQMVARDRTRGRGTPPALAVLPTCPSSASPMVTEASIRRDGDWAEVSVPRCSGASPGVDEFGMLYFEKRWRFIYTDLFEGRPAPETAQR